MQAPLVVELKEQWDSSLSYITMNRAQCKMGMIKITS